MTIWREATAPAASVPCVDLDAWQADDAAHEGTQRPPVFAGTVVEFSSMRMPRNMTEWILAVFGGFLLLMWLGLALAVALAD